ncbi:MAG TPA: NCS2 family permease [Candidatus Acidoferrales bacterium]|nr:NCS2 family permease [Candidatus Acidoferrales bacterium]
MNLQSIFQLQEHGTSVRREVLAGLTTFTTMSYIIVVNPAVLKAAGIPAGPSMVATILAAVFGCLLMAFYANRPFAIAPYMGENAFIAFTVCGVLGLRWQTALGAIFIAGVLFVLLTAFRVRSWIVESVPASLRYSFGVGIGLFLTFIGLTETGIVTLGVPGAPVRSGALTSAPVLVAVFGVLLMAVLVIRKVPGALLIGIIVTTLVAYAVHIAQPPRSVVSMPPSIRPLLWQIDLRGTLSAKAFPVVITIFIMAFVDTMGTLIGLSARAGFLDENGNLPHIERPMMVDALATCFSPAIGTSTSGAFIESATGIEAGGRTGLTALVVAICFAASLFFSPFVGAVPAQAYAPALILVGLFMLAPITRIDFDDFTESVPAFAVVTLMCFTYNIAVGMTAGFVLYPLCKLAAGRLREVRPGLWVLTALSLLFFIFYPYT